MTERDIARGLFSWLRSIPWQLDGDDLPQTTIPPRRSPLPKPTAPARGNGFSWRSLAAAIDRDVRVTHEPIGETGSCKRLLPPIDSTDTLGRTG